MSTSTLAPTATPVRAPRTPRTEGTVFKRSPLQRLGVHAALLILCIPATLPLIWMVSTSLKSDKQLFPKDSALSSPLAPKNLVPSPVEWANYPEALASMPFATYLRNTLMLCALNVLGAVGASAIVAYGFARLKFRGRGLLFMLMISTMALPGQVTMIPVFKLYSVLGWYGTFLPLTVHAFFGTPFYIFLLTQFYKTLPEELAEAARIDGANEWMIFWRIMLPLSKPALATCALFQFLHTWNDFFGPLLYINNPSKYTLAYGLQQFLSSNGGGGSAYGGKWAELMAASTMFTVPIIILFFFAQRTFIQGIATTGSKA